MECIFLKLGNMQNGFTGGVICLLLPTFSSILFFLEFSQSLFLRGLGCFLLLFLRRSVFGILLAIQSMANYHQFLSILCTSFSHHFSRGKLVCVIKTVMNFEYEFLCNS